MAFRGRDIKLQVEVATVWTTIALMRTRTISISNDGADITTDDDNGWITLLGDTGLRALTISGGAVFSDAASLEIIQDAALSNAPIDLKIIFPNSKELTGACFVSGFEIAAEHLDAVAATFTLLVTGIPTFLLPPNANGVNWVEKFAPGSVVMGPESLVVHSTKNLGWYVLDSTSTPYKSTDEGQTWAVGTQEMSAYTPVNIVELKDASVYDFLVFDLSNAVLKYRGDTDVWDATGETLPGGVSTLTTPLLHSTGDVFIGSKDLGTVSLARRDVGAQTWATVALPGTAGDWDIHAIAESNTDPLIIVAVGQDTNNTGDIGYCYSTDGGSTWNARTEAATPGAYTTVAHRNGYWMFGGNGGEIWRLSDAGLGTVAPTLVQSPIAGWALNMRCGGYLTNIGIVMSPTRSGAAIAEIKLLVSNDDGATWVDNVVATGTTGNYPSICDIYNNIMMVSSHTVVISEAI